MEANSEDGKAHVIGFSVYEVPVGATVRVVEDPGPVEKKDRDVKIFIGPGIASGHLEGDSPPGSAVNASIDRWQLEAAP